MSLIINIRGTGGSGKTTVVTRLMELLPNRREVIDNVTDKKGTRARLVGYHCTPAPEYLGTERQLFVVGKYTTATGGCDTLPNLDTVYGLIDKWAPPGSAIYEGIMAAEEVTRAVALHKHHKLLVIGLTTPLEECLASIRERRQARGEQKPLNPRNTTDRYARVGRALARLRDAGVWVERLNRQDAYARVRQLLGV